MSYLDTTQDLYKKAALKPEANLCCSTNPTWQLPELNMPKIMQEMNYGCGSTVNPSDLTNNPKILYVGVGGGMELLQFAYYSRQKGGVVGVDVVDEMLEASRKNFKEAEALNPWFKSDFVELKKGDALNLPLEDNSVDVAAQNCLFNIFKTEDLKKAIAEMYRVLKPKGRLVMSDPICEQPMNDTLRNDETLRAMCLSGCIPMWEYIKMLTDAGFGSVEVRSKKPYRILDPNNYPTDELIYIESIEICAIKNPMPSDGACVYTGRAAIYFGDETSFTDTEEQPQTFPKNQPIRVCDKKAKALKKLNRNDIFISDPTYTLFGGSCC